MKFLKYSLLALLPSAPAFGAVIENFESYTPGEYLEDTAAWTTSEAEVAYVGVSTSTSSQIGVIGFDSAGPAASTFTSTISTTTALGDLDSGFATYQYQQLSFDVALVFDVGAPLQFPERNTFGFSLSDSADNVLVTVNFTPTTFEGTDVWEVSYLFAGGTEDFTTINLQDAGIYSMYLTFFQDGIAFNFGPADGSQVFHFQGDPTGYDASTTVGGDLTFFGLEGAGYGDNSMLIDDIEVNAVPEPSIAALAGLATLGFLRRRRA